jgi:hypothetical protein
MKADFDGSPDTGAGPPSADGWLRLLFLIVAVVVVVAVAVLVLPRS